MPTLEREPTPAEVLAEVAQASIENRIPFDYRNPIDPPASTEDDDDSLFSAADLTGLLLETCEKYTIPNTKKHLFVFGLSDADTRLMIEWSMRRPLEADDTPMGRTLHNAALTLEAQLYQVLLSCRRGPRRDSKRVFSLGDIEAVRKNLPTGAIKEIVRISDRLSGSEETISPGVRRFFGSVRRACAIWFTASASWDACPPGLKDMLTQIESLASRAERRGIWDSGMSGEVEAL